MISDIVRRIRLTAGLISPHIMVFDGNSSEYMTDPNEIFQKIITSKEPAVEMIDDDHWVGGIDFRVKAPFKKWDSALYWPLQNPNDEIVQSRPRYTNFRDAALVSINESGGHQIVVGVWPRNPPQGASKVILNVSSFVDDEDFIPTGTMKTWWQELLAALHVSENPIKWRGDDDNILR